MFLWFNNLIRQPKFLSMHCFDSGGNTGNALVMFAALQASICSSNLLLPGGAYMYVSATLTVYKNFLVLVCNLCPSTRLLQNYKR